MDRRYLDRLTNHFRTNAVLQICTRLAKASVLHGGMHILEKEEVDWTEDEHRFLVTKWQTFNHDVLDQFWTYGFCTFELLTNELYPSIMYPSALKLDHLRVFVKISLRGEFSWEYVPRIENDGWNSATLMSMMHRIKDGGERKEADEEEEENIQLPLEDIHT